ncbi:ABC transporter substrate-binding protein [Paenibacillus sp. NPDC056579]|uniref:ABC transporter substrate-binding protein n=1 Tax=Paenibacillus sp. NPDC056579 TaxID=3345871 RepID=UPI0036BA4672
MVKSKSSLILWMAMIVALAACEVGGEKSDAGKEAKQTDTTPVKLKIYFSNGSITDQDLNSLIVEELNKKYPYITVEAIRPGKGTTIEELIAADQTPDIIYASNGDLNGFKILDLLEDITPLAKEQQVDFGRFDPIIFDSVRAVSDKGEVYGLPFFAHFSGLYYNKDIFDKFGVPYPEDGMTWEDTMELAKKLSREDNGVTYKGLDPDTIARMAMQLPVTVVDHNTNRARIDSNEWREIFTLAKGIWSIPNNKPDKLNSYQSRNWFMKDKNIAMLPYNNLLNIGLEDATKNGLNWDVAQYPSYKEKPNIYSHVDAQIFAITKTSKHKSQAMQLLSVAVSDEVQLKSTRTTARLSALKNPEIKTQLGADMPFLKGKNLQSIFKSSPAPAPLYSPYDALVRPILFQGFEDYFNGKDLNSALRETDEKINKWIDANKK